MKIASDKLQKQKVEYSSIEKLVKAKLKRANQTSENVDLSKIIKSA